ncbi:MAG: DUF6064 family protein [Alphaproteobacteria bacterium]|nr:DUF6064 family protein [Alphaproteobacteria bacterium]
METWLTYSPQDFLMFSERVYWRLFERHNAALWPAQIPALLVGITVLFLLVWDGHLRTAWVGRGLAAILAVAWAVTGLGFLPGYASINWAVGDLIPVFLGQAALLLFLGFRADALETRLRWPGRWIAVAVCLYGLVVPPMAAVLADRSAGAEVFALMPDPTAIVTLGAVLAAGRRWTTLLLAIVPAIWCVASWATLAVLGTAQAWIFAPVALAVLVLLVLIGAPPRLSPRKA